MKVKIFLVIISVMIMVTIGKSQCNDPNVFHNELNVEINFNNAFLNVSGLRCDICIYGIEGSNNCECRNNCSLNEDQQNELEKCINDCEETYSDDLVYLDRCLDVCEDYEESIINECQNECGELPEAQREVVDYDVQINIWYNTGFTETFEGQPNVIAGTPVLLGQPPNTITVNLNHQFPEEPISYCYIVQTTLVYDDGTCCVYFDYDCFNLG